MVSKGFKHSEKTRKKMSIAHTGKSKPWSIEVGRRNKGRKRSEETKKKIREARKNQVMPKWTEHRRQRFLGDNNPSWKGGVSTENQKIRTSREYVWWRMAVFAKDNWTCQECGKRGIELHADHIKPFSLFPELRFAIDNGRTLCVPCHKKTDTYAGKINKKHG